MAKKTLMNIINKDDTYFMNIMIKTKDIREDADQYYFSIVERYNGSSLILDSNVLETNDESYTFQVVLDFKKHKKLFLDNSRWDVYFNIEVATETISYRIAVPKEHEHYPFYSIVLRDELKMFYPYTTIKGRLSFQLSDFNVLAEIDNIEIENNIINFSGYFNFPPYYRTTEYELEEINISIENLINEEKKQISVNRFEREDIHQTFHGNDNLKNVGFKSSINLNELVDRGVLENSEKFQIYLNVAFKHGYQTILYTTPIKFSSVCKRKVKVISKINNTKIKTIIRPTKKLKNLLLHISKYSYIAELKKSMKNKWLKFKRSKKTRKLYQKVFSFVGKLPANSNLIMFESFHGKQYSDNPRAIYEYLKEHYPHLKMYWSIDKNFVNNFKDKDVEYIRKHSIKWLFKMARAKYWVFNTRLPLWVPKPNHTIYLQTWHGTPLKRLATDMDEVRMPGTNTVKYKKNFVTEANRWDYLVSPNAYSSEIFKRAFQFNGSMIESGYPRNDFLINANNQVEIEKLKERMQVPKDKKIILYAPTWRDNQFYAKGKYKFDLELDLNLLKENFSDDYIVLLRLHYLVAENIDLNGFENFVYDFSNYADIRELYLISDILITDYSSVFFDYANLKRPMIFFVYDIEDYRDNLRGFYFDFEKYAPGPLVKTTEEIIEVIKDIDQNGFKPSDNINDFYNKFCYLEDGNATKRVVDEVFKL